MHCLKCGRETESDQVFCVDCALEMEKYPVKPGTVVQLPKRESHPVRKTTRRRAIPLDDQVKYLKNAVRILVAALALAAAIIAAMSVPTAEYWGERKIRPGQNYSSTAQTVAVDENLMD